MPPPADTSTRGERVVGGVDVPGRHDEAGVVHRHGQWRRRLERLLEADERRVAVHQHGVEVAFAQPAARSSWRPPSSRPTRMSRTLDTTSGRHGAAADARRAAAELELELAPAERVQLDDDHVGRDPVERVEHEASTRRPARPRPSDPARG